MTDMGQTGMKAREMFYSLPLSLKPLDDPNHDPGESIVMDADTAHLTTITNRSFAEDAVHAINNYTASLSREAALVEALRRLAIRRHERPAYGGTFIYNGGSCDVCKSAWERDEPEHHEDACLLTHSKSPAA